MAIAMSLEADGAFNLSKETQPALLLLKLNNVANATIHRLLEVNHKAIEDADRRLCALGKEYVEAKQKDIQFGNGSGWEDVEAHIRCRNQSVCLAIAVVIAMTGC